MPSGAINDPKHWRDRAAAMRALADTMKGAAAEMRALADIMKDAETIAIMHRLADDYDKLAERAAQRQNGNDQNRK
jgi:hypothetical protein